MDTDHNSRPPPLPAKLRWRPYANGNSLKVKKPKKDAIQDMNAKAVAHKMRGKQYYTGKASQLPTGVRLQWEEAETIESMSTGGHPHNHHYHHSSSSESDSDTSSPNTPRRTSTTSTSSSNSNSSPTSSKPFSNAIQRAISSLPSPPSSQPLAPTSGMDLVGGQADFGLFNASLPGLTGTDFMKHGLPLATLASNTAYQLALDALFQPQRNLFQTTSNTTNNNKFDAANAASMPTNTSQATNIFGSVPLSVVSRDPNPVLSNDDLLNMASIDELLSSCGYAEPMDTSMMMSPTITDQSLNSSPMSSLVDFSNNSRGTSPAATSFSPMAIGQSIEALLAQPIYPITQQQQVSQSSQQGLFTSTTTTTSVSVSAPSNPYVILAEDFSAPFSYITAGGVDSTGAPTAWPSLFPEPTSAPQRMEIATQTDGPYSPATSPAPKSITAAAIQSTLGLTDEELDPDWLNFLDEASPLFTDAELPPSPPHSGDEDIAPPRTERSSNQRATPKNWADQLLKPDISTPPSGHRGFPSSGALGGVGQLGSGGLIRTLQGTNQQKYNKPSSTKSPSEGATSSEKSANAPTATISPSPSSNTEDASHQNDTSSAFGDLMAMIRNLWTKKE
ncbi:hypothetical protein CPB97_010166 [Podila verticillata]|nr:hypothetical protein CPB97_010166 [Podila verticillata]